MRKQVLAITVAALALSGCAVAQTPKADDEHSAHYPPGSAPAASAPAPGSTPAPGAFEQQMKAMQAMHQKMQAAKTPAERAALMDAHMKLMQSVMAMMGQVRGAGAPGAAGGMGMMMPPGGAPGAGAQSSAGGAGMPGMMGMHQQMERRMAMMEQMMQMMVDREAAMPRK